MKPPALAIIGMMTATQIATELRRLAAHVIANRDRLHAFSYMREHVPAYVDRRHPEYNEPRRERFMVEVDLVAGLAKRRAQRKPQRRKARR